MRRTAAPFDPIVFALFFFGLLVVTLVAIITLLAAFSRDYFPIEVIPGLFGWHSGPFGFVFAVEFLSAFVMEREVAKSICFVPRYYVRPA